VDVKLHALPESKGNKELKGENYGDCPKGMLFKISRKVK
jgi:hypothetical protein